MSTWRSERARVASFTRSRTPDDPDLLQARLNLRAEHLAEHVERVVSTAPPLSAEQRAHIASLLNTPTVEAELTALGGGPDDTV